MLITSVPFLNISQCITFTLLKKHYYLESLYSPKTRLTIYISQINKSVAIKFLNISVQHSSRALETIKQKLELQYLEVRWKHRIIAPRDKIYLLYIFFVYLSKFKISLYVISKLILNSSSLANIHFLFVKAYLSKQ